MATVATERDSLSAYGEARASIEGAPLEPGELRLMDAYWRAANYLAVGQIYLYDNPLLREPLKLEHFKPRLLGHWGTTPGRSPAIARSRNTPAASGVRAVRRGSILSQSAGEMGPR